MSECGKCKIKFKQRESQVGCEGTCNKWFHATCANFTDDEYNLLGKSKNLFFWCSYCRNNCEVTDKTQVLNISSVINDINSNLCKVATQSDFSNLNTSFDALNADITNLINSTMSNLKIELLNSVELKLAEFLKNVSPSSHQTAPSTTFSSIVRRSDPPLLIKPKNSSQSTSTTKSEILKTIDPIITKISLTDVKKANNGALIVTCDNDEDPEKLKNLINSDLSNKYEVKQLPVLNPRIRVVGITENLSKERLLNYLITQNKSCFDNNFKCEILHICPLKKKKDVYQALLQVDRSTYNSIIEAEKLFVCYDYCAVYDAIELRRCYNCCGFHHFAKQCSKPLTCPQCAGNHSIKNCDTSVPKCINCVRYNETHQTNISTAHNVWNSDCHVFTNNLKKFKSCILGK